MQHLYDNDALNLISGFREILWQPSEGLLLLHKWKHSNTIQYNKLRCLTYFKQSYCKDVQIYTIFVTNEAQLQGKFRSCRAENGFLISNIFVQKVFVSNSWRMIFHQNQSFCYFTRMTKEMFRTKFRKFNTKGEWSSVPNDPPTLPYPTATLICVKYLKDCYARRYRKQYYNIIVLSVKTDF